MSLDWQSRGKEIYENFMTIVKTMCNIFLRHPTTHPNSVYQHQLQGQVVEKLESGVRDREREALQQNQHFQSWDTFWGRPGYGAPRDSTNRENLMKNLYFAEENKKVSYELL